MTTVYQFSNKEWKEKVDKLNKAIEEAEIVLWHTRVTRYSPTTIALEGGRLPIMYNIETKELLVWNRAASYSNGTVPLRLLNRLESVLVKWSTDELN